MFPRFAFSLVSIITILGLTACSAENDPDAGAKENSANVSGESEFAEAQQANAECLEDLGFQDIESFSQGGMQLSPHNSSMPQDDVQDLVKKCSDSSGLTEVEVLHTSLASNPNNEDWQQLNVDCLIREGVVEPGFTKEDLDQWFATDDPMLRTGSKAKQCLDDPLGLLDGNNDS